MLIYKVTNKVNGKTYIGQTNRAINDRWREHCKPALKTRSYLSNAIQKYGTENFIVEELCRANTQEELDRLEIELVKSHSTMYPDGYNLKVGGLGGLLSDEAREKVRRANVGKRHSEETKAKLSKSSKGRPNIEAAMPVVGTNVKTGEKIYFKSVKEANSTGIFSESCIHRCATGERGKHKGFVWKYLPT